MNRKTVSQKLANYRWLWKKNWELLLLRQEKLNTQQSKLKARIERAAIEWLINPENTDLLLRGEALVEAEEFYNRSGNLLSLDVIKFIVKSSEFRDRVASSARKERQYRRLVTASFSAILVGVSFFTLSSTNSLYGTLELEGFSTGNFEEIHQP